MEAILSSELEVQCVLIDASKPELGKIKFLAEKRGIEIRQRRAADLKKFFSTQGQGASRTHPGISAIVKKPEPQPLKNVFENASRVLVFDKISDPGNAGSLLRTAYLFGWDAVVTTKGSCDLYGHKAVRASAGAIGLIPWITGGVAKEILGYAREMDFQVFVGEPSDSKAAEFPSQKELENSKVMLVMGNEAHGPASTWPGSREIAISTKNGPIDSLSVAHSGAILLHLLRKL